MLVRDDASKMKSDMSRIYFTYKTKWSMSISRRQCASPPIQYAITGPARCEALPIIITFYDVVTRLRWHRYFMAITLTAKRLVGVLHYLRRSSLTTPYFSPKLVRLNACGFGFEMIWNFARPGGDLMPTREKTCRQFPLSRRYWRM